METEVAQNEEDTPTAKRKKKLKRPRSPPTSMHSEKVYIQAANTNDNIQETSANVNGKIL